MPASSQAATPNRQPEPLKIPFVLDTSLFSNPVTQSYFAEDLESAAQRFLEIARARQLDVYMPVSIFRELGHFATQNVLDNFRKYATVRAPDMHNLNIPATTLKTFVSDLRQRVNKGLQIAEKAIRSENQPENVRWVRQQYREALRSGIVDSVEDLDVVLLAKEVAGAVLSADQGIARMAEELAIEVFSAREFLNRYTFAEHEDEQNVDSSQ